jgi:DNA replication protein DnaC
MSEIDRRMTEDQARMREEDLSVRRAQAAEIMGPRYVNCTFDSFVISPQYRDRQERAVAAARAYAAELGQMLAQGTNLVFFGPCGTGKDHLVSSVVKAEPTVRWPRGITFESMFRRMQHRTGAELFSALRAAMSNGKSEISVLRECTACGFLLFSDPTPPGGGTLTEFQRSALYHVIDSRYSQKRPVLCTVNAASLDDFYEQLSAPIADRLLDGALIVECNWPSFRKPREVINGRPA